MHPPLFSLEYSITIRFIHSTPLVESLHYGSGNCIFVAISFLARVLARLYALSPIVMLSNPIIVSAQTTTEFQNQHLSLFPTKSCLQLKIREVSLPPIATIMVNVKQICTLNRFQRLQVLHWAVKQGSCRCQGNNLKWDDR